MEIKKLSSTVVYLKSKIPDFILHNKTITYCIEYLNSKIDTLNNDLVTQVQILKSVDQTINTKLDDIDVSLNNLNEKIETVTFESECDVEITYIPDSGNKFKITRIQDDMMFESNDAKLEFNIPHNLGLIPIIQIYTKDDINDDYSFTITDFLINETSLKVLFTEPVFCRIIFKA